MGAMAGEAAGGRPIAMVTGGNRGLGKAVVRGLAGRGYRVVLHARTPARAQAAVEELAPEVGRGLVEPVAADLERPAEIAQAVETVLHRHASIDALVHGAGVVMARWRSTEEGLETSLVVNHLGAVRVTQGLLPALLAGAPSRVVLVTSHVHGPAHAPEVFRSSPRFDGRRAWAQTNLLRLLFAFDLAEALQGSGVDVNAVDPGAVDTRLRRNLTGDSLRAAPARALGRVMAAGPAAAAEGPLHAATAPELQGRSGLYLRKGRVGTPRKAARDPRSRERAREWTRELLGTDWRVGTRAGAASQEEPPRDPSP